MLMNDSIALPLQGQIPLILLQQRRRYSRRSTALLILRLSSGFLLIIGLFCGVLTMLLPESETSSRQHARRMGCTWHFDDKKSNTNRLSLLKSSLPSLQSGNMPLFPYWPGGRGGNDTPNHGAQRKEQEEDSREENRPDLPHAGDASEPQNSPHSQRSKQQKQQRNTQLAGWTPDIYPNPLRNPTRCGIAYLQHPSQELELCDPDWVLGGVYLENIAFALTNFTHLFGEPPSFLELNDAPLLEPSYADPATPATTATLSPTQSMQDDIFRMPTIHIGVAAVRKMNLPAVLRAGSYYTYEDEDDMVNDAAQIFARYLQEAWCLSTGEASACSFGILIFLSVQDRVCFIATGKSLAPILPWWRLEHVVGQMKPLLRHGEFGPAILRAMDELAILLFQGPPTLQDRVSDFVSRFGVVIGFAICTFLFGAWGEYRDRRKRWQYAERRSKLTSVEAEKAKVLQQSFKTQVCPICLEPLLPGSYDDLSSVETKDVEGPAEDDEEKVPEDNGKTLDVEVDEYGIPRKGSDGRPIKLLRCGHIFCDSCWKTWVHSGHGNPLNCPVCRQDVGRSSPNRKSSSSNSNSTTVGAAARWRLLSMRSSDSAGLGEYPSYDAIGTNTTAEHPPSADESEGEGLDSNQGVAASSEQDLEPTETSALLGGGSAARPTSPPRRSRRLDRLAWHEHVDL